MYEGVAFSGSTTFFSEKYSSVHFFSFLWIDFSFQYDGFQKFLKFTKEKGSLYNFDFSSYVNFQDPNFIGETDRINKI